MIDETEMNVVEYSGAEHATSKSGQVVEVGAEYDRLEATGNDSGNAQKEYYDNTLESIGNDIRHAHGITEDKNYTTATSGACKEIPGRNVSNYDSLQHY